MAIIEMATENGKMAHLTRKAPLLPLDAPGDRQAAFFHEEETLERRSRLYLLDNRIFSPSSTFLSPLHTANSNGT
jgi:hypothetical protein